MSVIIGQFVDQAFSLILHTKKEDSSPGDSPINNKIEMSTVVDVTPSSEDEFDKEDYEAQVVDDVEVYKDFPPSIQLPAHATKICVKRVLLIYNPFAGSHRGEKIARKAKEVFEEHHVEVESIALEHKGHAAELCEKLDLSQYDVLCCLGGDGTMHECINGFMRRTDLATTIPLALVPAGTGNSFVLELQGGTKVKRAVKHILRGLNCPIDIAKLTFPRGTGEDEVIYSFNSIHWGLASKVNVTAEKLRWMGAAIRYTTAALLELSHGVKTRAKIVVELADGTITEYNDEFCLVIANNIVSAAKGMKMAPNAKLNDGLIDLLMFKSSKTLDLMTVFRKLYDGTHTELDHVDYLQVKSFSITPYKKDNPNVPQTEEELNVPQTEEELEVAEELLDVDGELKGLTPFKCVVIPSAIRIIV